MQFNGIARVESSSGVDYGMQSSRIESMAPNWAARGSDATRRDATRGDEISVNTRAAGSVRVSVRCARVPRRGAARLGDACCVARGSARCWTRRGPEENGRQAEAAERNGIAQQSAQEVCAVASEITANIQHCTVLIIRQSVSNERLGSARLPPALVVVF